MVWMELAQHLVATVSFERSFDLSSELVSVLAAIGSWQEAGHGLLQLGGDWSHAGSRLESHLAVLFNTDVFAATRSFFDHFFKTGQAWALLIGIVVGYLLRGLTSYG
jgi:hypothetical protein